MTRSAPWVAAALLVAALAPYDGVAAVDPSAAGLGPTWSHLLGTDALGRDVLRRLLASTRAFAGQGAVAAALCTALGLPLGLGAGWWGGAVGATVRALAGAVEGVPRLAWVLLLCALAPAGGLALGVAAGIGCAPGLAVAMAEKVEALKTSEFVLAARAHGIGDARIVLFHLGWANGRGLVMRHALTTFAWTMVAEASLSYLGGLGVPEPAPSWGNMIAMQLGRNDGNALAFVAPAVLAWACSAALATGGAPEDGAGRA